MWTPFALESEHRRLSGELWRVVEYQHRFATDRLTETQADQALLEDLLEASKPPFPPAAQHLHYLLKTPFRYDAPYPCGSRFRRAHTSLGVFYGSEQKHTALAEIAYYRLLFLSLAGQPLLPSRPVNHTLFAVDYATERGLDLTKAPLNRDHQLWTDPHSYAATQTLADNARKAHIDAIRYQSVRDPEAGNNVALLSPGVFRGREPRTYQTWASSIKPEEVHLWRTSGDERLVFARSVFER